MKLENYAQFGGRQVEAAALRNVLAYEGVVAPHSGEPFGEAMLFGIGGGIGLGYFVYQMPGHVSLFLATRITTQESGRPGFVGTMAERLGAGIELQTSSSAAAADKKLKAALAQGRPAIAWVDQRFLPYFGTPAGYHTLVIYGLDDERDEVYVADRPAMPLAIRREQLERARQSGEVSKFQSLLLRAPEQVSLETLRAAVRQGIADCLTQMEEGFGPPNFKSNFGLAALEKWAGLLVDRKDKRGWPKLLPAGPALFDALLTLYDHIENRGDGGPAYRELYAEFVEEAGLVLEQPGIAATADLFREAGRRWRELSAAMLPDSQPLFREARDLADRRRSLSETEGVSARNELQTIGARLGTIKGQVEPFPLGEDEVSDLLAGLRERVLAVHEAELWAVNALKHALGDG